ncbi:hypothetical protein [uncultured Kordia sp.]|uniref:hypothetical protein n=1 Tax=uncultured Kordia sp. TaxID=507699 RepID=UPI00260FEC19|nr:hypothetical protein [uncultured Kordia sp.]
MKTTKRNLGKLTLSKLMIAQVGDPRKICGGSLPRPTENCTSQNICTLLCAGDTIDTQ